MDYRICIPSYNRIDCLRDKTLTMLSNNNINKENIYIYVPMKSYVDYVNAFPDYSILMCGSAEPSIVAQRKYILTHCLHDGVKYVVMIDDDIDKLVIKGEKDLTDFTALEGLIKTGFEKCEEHNTKIWGIYPIDNGYFMKNTISTDLKFIQGTLQGIICDDASSPFMLWNEDNCEDFARTLHYYTLYESIVRINYIAPKTKFAKTKGGLQSVYDKDESLKSKIALDPL